MKDAAVVIGAGPAGLTAAHELCMRTEIRPVVLEMEETPGGLARTVTYRGNRMDIGGHRFFTQSDRVLDWWLARLPLQSIEGGAAELAYQGARRRLPVEGPGPDPDREDRVMLLRPRKSRIYFGGAFFDYPLRPDLAALRKLGMGRALRFGASYLRRRCAPVRPERSLEDFFRNRFGDAMYRTFFQAYTEKVWGVPCSEISAEWGAQRIKALSLGKTLGHWLGGGRIGRAHRAPDSLTEWFLYPKLGPGQLWEQAAAEVEAAGGRVVYGRRVEGLECSGGRVTAVTARDSRTGALERYPCAMVFSSMPAGELVRALHPEASSGARAAAAALPYRDFITAGVLLSELAAPGGMLDDSWLYIQDPGVRLGRVQIYNNWSPYLVAKPGTVWLGLEYFCNEGDALWRMEDGALLDFAVEELVSAGLARRGAVLDGTVLRMRRAYPSYTGGYARFPEVRAALDGIENLITLGRNGMHRYNNQDHAMLTAMTAVDGLVSGALDKAAVWAVNTGDAYLETMPRR